MKHILSSWSDGGGSKCDVERIQSRNDSSTIWLGNERSYKARSFFKDNLGFYKVEDWE